MLIDASTATFRPNSVLMSCSLKPIPRHYYLSTARSVNLTLIARGACSRMRPVRPLIPILRYPQKRFCKGAMKNNQGRYEHCQGRACRCCTGSGSICRSRSAKSKGLTSASRRGSLHHPNRVDLFSSFCRHPGDLSESHFVFGAIDLVAGT